jgi:uncharacterized protein YfaS (alpha-2-macroglobulin family)
VERLGGSRAAACWVAVALCWIASCLPALAVTIDDFSPQGTAAQVRQVTARFSDPMVPFGDLRDVAPPFAIACAEPGTARWVDSRTWAYDFTRDLPAGIRCTFTARRDLQALDGTALGGRQEFSFSTGGPAIASSLPGEGTERIEEDQVFVLGLNGEATRESVLAHAGFDIDGIGERVGVTLIEGDARAQLLASLPAWLRPDGPTVALRARQTFPNKATVRLVWGAGIASPSGVATDAEQVLAFKVRPVFSARLTCERENAKAGCIPLTPIRLRFSAPVPWDLASQIRLIGPNDSTRGPLPPDDPVELVNGIAFGPPFPEHATFHAVLPSALRDDAGRALANRDAPALTVTTGALPPLAKFAARFGILEAHADPALPITIRNLGADVGGQQLAVDVEPTGDWRTALGRLYGQLTGRAERVPPQAPQEILPWLRRLAAARRSTSIFAGATPPAGREIRAFTLPQPEGSDAFQVVGIPFQSPGLYVVEIASPRLGTALLGTSEPMYVPAMALVTNLAVHFEWAHDDALAWVTTLDTARPVEDARISVRDCNGTVLATATTDGDGIARVHGLPDDDHAPHCTDEDRFAQFDDLDYRDYYRSQALTGLDGGLLVVAQTDDDLSFVHSSWLDGIEPWRFQLPADSWDAPTVVHTVLDRPLFRAGETVHMKHVLRRKAMVGFAFPSVAERPTAAVIRHLGSDETYETPLTWDDAGIAEQEWQIPAGAKLGQYEIALKRDDRQFRSGTFRVEQFRVPLMKGSVQVPADAQVAVASVPVAITVQYLAGGPAAGLPATLRAQVRDREPPKSDALEHGTFANGRVREELLRHSEAEDDNGTGGSKPILLPRQTLTLDAGGTAHTDLAGVPSVDTVRELLVEAEYRDPNGEAQTTTATVPLWPAAIVPGIDVQHWAGAKGHVTARVAVLDTRGRPVPDTPVHVDAFRHRFYSHRKRVVGGFYVYEHVDETRRIGRFCDARTGADGTAECSGPPPADGELVLQVTASDRAGRTAAAHESVYVSGEDEWGFPVEASDRIDLVPERRQYEPGETARLQVRMPFRRATALVTVQREGIGSAQVVPISAKDPVVEVPVHGNYAPNVFVSVLALRGRVEDAQPTALVDLGKPAFKLGIAELRVGWRTHTLKVDVHADRPAYRVRDTATVHIAVRTPSGDPPPEGSEVALAAVDEGLLELMPNTSWDLLDAMMGRRGYGARTATSEIETIGKRHFGRKALPHGGGGGRQTTRELFDTLLLWRARVPLDADGNATADVPLNDSLTSFRIAAIATGGVGQFGTGSTDIRSTQDLMILGGLPPLVRQGDAFPAQFTVRNTTARALDVTLHASVEGLADALPEQRIALAAGAAEVVAWPVRVPPVADHLRYTVEASAADGPADRLVVMQRVAPAVPVQTVQSTLLRAAPELRVPVERPADALADRGGITVAAAASLAGSLAPLRDWLRAYPYSCLEQKVSIAVGLGDEARWKEIVATLPSYVDGDGLLKFFPTLAAGSDVLTAYVLSIATAAGWALPNTLQQQLINGLQAFVDGRVRRQSPLAAPDLVLRKLAAIDALARLGSADPSMLDSITIAPNLWPTSAVLDWWSILERLSAIPHRDARRREAEQVIRARLDLQGTALGFSTSRTDQLGWLMTGPDVNALRLIDLLLEFDRWRDDLPRLVHGALARQRRGNWETTVADAWGTLALRRFAAAFEATPVTGTTTVSLDQTAERLDWTAAPAPIELPWPAAASELRVDHHGTGTPWATVSARAAIPLTAPLASGYRITKTITPIESRTPGQWHVGDQLRVRIAVDAQSDASWVVVDDPVPAGAAHLGGGLGHAATPENADVDGDIDTPEPAFVERRFDAFVAYYDFAPKGRLVTEYTVRLNQSGHFELPPTRVEALYTPEMFGEIPNAAIDVAP